GGAAGQSGGQGVAGVGRPAAGAGAVPPLGALLGSAHTPTYLRADAGQPGGDPVRTGQRGAGVPDVAPGAGWHGRYPLGTDPGGGALDALSPCRLSGAGTRHRAAAGGQSRGSWVKTNA